MKKYNSIITFIIALFINTATFASVADKHNDRNINTYRLENREEFLSHSKHADDWYQTFKKELRERYRTSYYLDISYMAQNTSPHWGGFPQQFIFSPYIKIEPFVDTKFGSGKLQVSFTGVRLFGGSVSKRENKLHVATGINDYKKRGDYYSQILYTHTMPGVMDWLSLSIGQYSIYFMDGVAPTSNQQSGFISYSLSQNASASYATSGLGLYLQISPNRQWILQFGIQDAHNIDGDEFGFSTLDDGDYTTYGYLSWSPVFAENFSGEYKVLFYDQPSTKEQYGHSQGWSFSFLQNFGRIFNIFGGFNGSTGKVVPVKRSVVAGIGFKDIFYRNPNDYFGISFARNWISRKAVSDYNIHKYENVLEMQYVFGIGKYITITPDLQLFMHPSLTTKKSTAAVFGLRVGVNI